MTEVWLLSVSCIVVRGQVKLRYPVSPAFSFFSSVHTLDCLGPNLGRPDHRAAHTRPALGKHRESQCPQWFNHVAYIPPVLALPSSCER